MKSFFVILALVVMIGAVIFSGCAQPAAPAPGPTPTTPTPSTPSAPAEILLGDVVCYTGGFATFGVNAFGVEAAVEDINNQGGIFIKEYNKKLPVKWISVDCQSDPNKVAPLTEDLILREKVNFIGPHDETPPFSPGRATMVEKYKLAGLIGTGPLEPHLEQEAAAGGWPHSYFYGLRIATPPKPPLFTADNPMQVLMVPVYLDALKEWSAQTNKKVAIYAADDTDGKSWYEAYAGMLKEQGYDCYGTDKKFGIFPLGTTDFTPIIKEWKATGCDILLGNCPATECGIMWKQCHTLGFHPKVFYAGRAGNFYYDIASWGGDLPEGVCAEIFWTPQTNGVGIGGTTSASLFDRFYKKTGIPMAQGLGWDYAAAQALFDSIERAGTLDPEAVVKALGETDLMTMQGRWMFDKEAKFRAYPVGMGQWQKVAPPQNWELATVFTYSDFLKSGMKPLLFPIPYD